MAPSLHVSRRGAMLKSSALYDIEIPVPKIGVILPTGRLKLLSSSGADVQNDLSIIDTMRHDRAQTLPVTFQHKYGAAIHPLFVAEHRQDV